MTVQSPTCTILIRMDAVMRTRTTGALQSRHAAVVTVPCGNSTLPRTDGTGPHGCAPSAHDLTAVPDRIFVPMPVVHRRGAAPSSPATTLPPRLSARRSRAAVALIEHGARYDRAQKNTAVGLPTEIRTTRAHFQRTLPPPDPAAFFQLANRDSSTSLAL
jgi:hypothetical protein